MLSTIHHQCVLANVIGGQFNEGVSTASATLNSNPQSKKIKLTMSRKTNYDVQTKTKVALSNEIAG